MENITTATFWQDRPVFVTGASGQIGGWLVRQLLAGGAELVCLVRDWVPQSELVRSGTIERVKVIRGDVCDLALIKRVLGEYEVNTVIHLAAQSIVGTANRDPSNTFETNIRGTWVLLEACRMNPQVKQIVVTSTDKVYGECEQLPYEESMALLAVYPHDVSKACAEMIARSYAGTYGLNIGITRLPNIFGGSDLNWNRIIPGTIRSVIRGQQPVINSNGRFIRDYLYVEDAAEAQLVLAEKLSENSSLRGEAFNISNETHLTVLELVERILKLMGSSLEPIILDQAKDEIPNQYMTARKAEQVLGWKPRFSMDEGLSLTIDWYRAFLKEQA